VRRVVAAMAAALGLAAVAFWGCATSSTAAVSTDRPTETAHDWQRYEPDGGWATYVPSPREYGSHLAETGASGDPQIGARTADPAGLAKSTITGH
jgi:hypothetical protein